jgi:hypothetical membrane protein
MTILSAGRWAAGLAAVLAIAAMFFYPGGNPYHREASRYLFFQNYLSDLGIRVAWGGRSNAISSWLFAGCLVVAAIALCACLIGVMQVHARSAAARLWAWAACLAGALSCISIVAVSLTPMDADLRLHESLSDGAIIPLPAVAALLGIASRRDPRFPRQSMLGWAVLLIILGLYVTVLYWHPEFGTLRGRTIQVTGQKLAVIAMVTIVPYQSWLAEQAATRSLYSETLATE